MLCVYVFLCRYVECVSSCILLSRKLKNHHTTNCQHTSHNRSGGDFFLFHKITHWNSKQWSNAGQTQTDTQRQLKQCPIGQCGTSYRDKKNTGRDHDPRIFAGHLLQPIHLTKQTTTDGRIPLDAGKRTYKTAEHN